MEQLNIEQKVDNQKKLDYLAEQGISEKEFIKVSEFNQVVDKTNELVEKANTYDVRYYSSVNGEILEAAINGIASGTGGKYYDSTDDAMAVDPLPENGVPFCVKPSNESESGIYIYNSEATNEMWEKIGDLEAKGEIVEGDVRAVSGGEVYEVTKGLQETIDYSNPTTLGTILANGNIGTSVTNADVSSVIPVNLGDIIEYKGTVGNTGLSVAGYNSADTNSSTFVSPLLVGDIYTTVQRIEITNPDIKFIRAGSRNAAYPNNTNFLSVKVSRSSITDLDNRVTVLENTPIPEPDFSLLVDITGSKTQGLVVRSDNGNLANLTNSGFPDTEVSDFIDVRDIDKLYVDGWFGNSVGVAGYDQDKVYNSRLADTNNASVNTIEYADNYELIIPEDVKFIKASTKDRNLYPLKVSIVSNLKTEVINLKEEVDSFELISPPKIRIENITETNFKVSVYNSEKKKYVVHNFVRTKQINTVSGVENLVTEDVWYPDSIIVDGSTIAQGNLNFIYMINATGDKVGENGHVGAGHGCVVSKWIKFYADGQEFDPTTLTEVLDCSTFSIKYLADCYAINKPISPSGANGFPKLDENNNPIVANQHSLDATYYADGRIEHRNRLYIKRDDTSFAQCHAAMNSCYRPYFDKVAFPNINEFTLNRQYIDEGIVVAEPIGCDLNIRTTQRVYSNEVTQFGSDDYPYMIKNTIINMDNSKQNNCNLYFYAPTSPNWLKVYMQPIICTSNPSSNSSLAEVFNNGDVIDVLVKREVFI